MVAGWVINLIVSVVLSVISYMLAPKAKTQDATAATLDDFELPTAEEGREIPVIFGTRDISGANVVWYGDLKTEAIKKKGGKK